LTGPPARAELVIGGEAGERLAFGHYSLRVRVRNEAGAAFRYQLTFDVTYSPPSFTDPPGMYPIVAKSANNNYPTPTTVTTTGGNYFTLNMFYPDNIPDIATGATKFVITWPRRATAIKYTVYVGESADFDKATALNSGNPFTVEQLNKYGEDGFLGVETSPYSEPSKRYWAWVKAANAYNEETLPSPAATRKTSAPMPDYFYLNTNDAGDTQKITVGNVQKQIPSLHDCGGYGDYYRFTPTTVKYWFGPAGSYDYLGDVVYHEAYDVTAADNGRFPDSHKDLASALGLPAGVFVIKYREGRVPSSLTFNDRTAGKMKRYGAVYYWGVGATKQGSGSNAGKKEASIVNQWGEGKHSDGSPHKYGAYAETVTYEDAIDRFTC
jgi:hypothetical protein